MALAEKGWPPPRRDALWEVSDRQLGVFTRGQALAAGYTRHQIADRQLSGAWERILPAVYHIRGTPLTWEGQAVAALLWAGPDSCLSHRTATKLWGLSGFDDAPIELTKTHSTRTFSELIIHRAPLPKTEVVRRGPIRITAVPRTLLDVAGVCSGAAAEAALDEALMKRLVNMPRLNRFIETDVDRGRRGAALLRALVERRDPACRPTESELERMTLRVIRGAGLPAPGQQEVICDDFGRFARVDFIYREHKVIVEVDGFSHHSSHQDWNRDMRRRNRLTRAGWRVYHVTYWDLKERPQDLVGWLRDVLSA